MHLSFNPQLQVIHLFLKHRNVNNLWSSRIVDERQLIICIGKDNSNFLFFFSVTAAVAQEVERVI